MRARESALIRLGEGSRRPSQWWLAWLVVMVIIVEVPQLGMAVGNAVLGAPTSSSAWYPLVAVLGSLAVLLSLWVWVRVKEGRPLATVGFRPRRQWPRLLVGFGIGAAMISAVVMLGLVIGAVDTGQSAHPVTGADAALLFVLWALGFLVQACCQVALIPGYLLQTSVRQLPAWVAILATSLLVAVLQTLNPISIVNLFLFAIFAALVTLQQGSLWLVAGIQAGWTCFQASVYGLPVGGIAAPTAVLSIGPEPGTPTLLSGGRFGLETGSVATMVLGLATVVAYVALRRTNSPAAGISPTAPSPTNAPRKGTTHVPHQH